MPKQTVTKKKPAVSKARSSRVNKSNSASSWTTKKKIGGITFIALFAAFGTYSLLQSSAANNPRFAEDPARGITYKDIKLAENGPCADSGESISPSDNHERSPEHSQRGEHAVGPENAKCFHPDGGPKGVDLRDRINQVDAMLEAQVSYDELNPAKDAGETPPPPLVPLENVGVPGSLSAVSPVNWPCIGTGVEGTRVVMMYVYPVGQKDRGATLRRSFESIARRTNAVYYNSGVASGGARQIRFHTNAQCKLSIASVAISGDINSYSNILAQLRSKSYNSSVRKYMVQVDGGNAALCGLGDRYADDRPGPENYNNGGNTFAVTWKACWNYAEPHELTHMMGSVQNLAPGANGRGHCFEQNDVMCYNDGSGVALQTLCPNTVDIWRFDCNKDTYFRSSGATGWLASHWNVADNSFLQR